ncbi:phosphoribosylformylglycinamidine synthase [Rhodotorula kratochvilovae]
MLVLAGASVFHPPQRAALLARVHAAAPHITSIDAVFAHFVEPVSVAAGKTLADPESKERKVLDALLKYGDDYALDGTRAAVQLAVDVGNAPGVIWVVPRAGTISPWSSKATDIAKMCTLDETVRRIERGVIFVIKSETRAQRAADLGPAAHHLHDRMTQMLADQKPAAKALFERGTPAPLTTIALKDKSVEEAKAKLVRANQELGLALGGDELDYLVECFLAAASTGRDPTDVELFMFAQVNSEHCRHKIFNAAWVIDGKARDNSLFAMIRNTHKLTPDHTISAYSDNAAVIDGSIVPRFAAGPSDVSDLPVYQGKEEHMPILIKVETHNHPTAVSPFPGAATGSGGEIRDEGAVGRGSRPKAGLSGFTVSNLLIPDFVQPWETDFGKPAHIASALDIMVEGPLGSSAFNNEFGRPGLTGYFRTFAEEIPALDKAGNRTTEIRGYHKPIMIAGGYGNVRPEFALKDKITPGARLIVLGGPGMLIGLGGGAASSMASGSSSADLDFASVQRENPEMQRRAQQVLDTCVSLGAANPIQSVHDVGAGGLSNALPELVHDADLGAVFEIRDVLVDDPGMSPMEIWCNESQERYVLAVGPEDLERFEAIAKRERCPYAVVGTATEEQKLVVTDRLLKEDAINLPMSLLFGKAPRMHRKAQTVQQPRDAFDSSLKQYLPVAQSPRDLLDLAVERILHLPSVGSKSFLITIGDRSISGLVARDQMVGPWQVPVADVAVTQATYGFDVVAGEAMAMGERTPLALLSPAASGRMAVAESLLNLAAADFVSLANVKLSANWMCAASHDGGNEGAALYEAVQAIGMDLCPALGVSIPVGKDSMSMAMGWNDDRGERKTVTAPLSLVVTAFSPVADVEKTWTPELQVLQEPTVLVFFDLANGKQRLGGSALAQVFKQLGSEAPDVEDAKVLKAFLNGCREIRAQHPDQVLAYHDRSDGGLFTTVVEMCFAGRVGAEVMVDAFKKDDDAIAALFNEELGAVFQVRQADLPAFSQVFIRAGVPSTAIHPIGRVASSREDQAISLASGGSLLWSSTRAALQQQWAETSYRMQALRDSPQGALQEFENIADEKDTGLYYQLSFDPAEFLADPLLEKLTSLNDRPKVAILREQGVNGHIEMAWSFAQAGFASVDVHMSDLISGKVSLADFKGVAACGGFSYGDVLGAGNGWANSILLNSRARREFEAFFNDRKDTFALAVCNGCQLFSQLRDLIPGAEHWPFFKQNLSGRFEGRVSLVEVADTPATKQSVFLASMAGSALPIAVAHGEGRATWLAPSTPAQGEASVVLRYVDPTGKPTERYPYNPNGSPGGATGVQALEGRVLAMMPHAERVTRRSSNSYYPREVAEAWQGAGPWFTMFVNARRWVA